MGGRKRLWRLGEIFIMQLGEDTCIFNYKEKKEFFSGVIYFSTCAENLGPSNLRAVRTALYSVRSKWYDIGVELEISHYTLDAIQKEKSDIKDCLTEMLKIWLSNTSPPPTWSGLIQALSSEPVAESRIAEDIRKQNCHQDEGKTTGSALGISVDITSYSRF